MAGDKRGFLEQVFRGKEVKVCWGGGGQEPKPGSNLTETGGLFPELFSARHFTLGLWEWRRRRMLIICLVNYEGEKEEKYSV